MVARRRKWFAPHLDKEGASGKSGFDADFREIVGEGSPVKPNLISSLCDNGMHMPVLDLDWPSPPAAIARIFTNVTGIALADHDMIYVPSTTPQHMHVYINVEISWEQMQRFLEVLAVENVIEENYAKHSIRKKSSFVRPPGTFKRTNSPPLTLPAGSLPPNVVLPAKIFGFDIRKKPKLSRFLLVTWAVWGCLVVAFPLQFLIRRQNDNLFGFLVYVVIAVFLSLLILRTWLKYMDKLDDV